MMREITEPQSKALAAFVSTLRRDWDPPGIHIALGHARSLAPAADVACAAIRAACDDNNRTPAVIAQPGRHWRGDQAVAPRFERPPDAKRCSVCSLAFNDCRAKWSGDHEFESVVDNRRQQTPPPDPAELRAAIASSSTDIPTDEGDPSDAT